jgi:hypothetical protein
VRLPERLRHRLEKASDKSGRSLNNEIVWRLERLFEIEAAPSVREANERIDRLNETVARIQERLEQIGRKP